ncbi:unnamed protein product [Amaranthus hypochondriacus]
MMEDQAKFIVEEVCKAVQENGQFVIGQLKALFESKGKENEDDVPEMLFGYEVVDWIGIGSFGSVYLVKDKDTGEPYAMKIIPLVDNEVTITIAREIFILYKIQHPNIVMYH